MEMNNDKEWLEKMAKLEDGQHISVGGLYHRLGFLDEPSGMDFKNFFRPDGKGCTDDKGRTLHQILSKDNEWLERRHDWVQRVFPLNEPSMAQPDAPLLTDDDIEFLKKDSLSKICMASALHQIMNRFFGLMFDKETQSWMPISGPDGFDGCKKNWMTPRNHNFLRLTRIMKFFMLVGEKPDLALSIYRGLKNLYDSGYGEIIGPITLEYWKEAVGIED